MGLGLSLCKNLVELNNGMIWVESELGKGSTFYFTINVDLQDKYENFSTENLNFGPDEKSNLQRQRSLTKKKVSMEELDPLLNELAEALSESNPTRIRSAMNEISKYDLPKLNILQKCIRDYDFDESISIIEEIRKAGQK